MGLAFLWRGDDRGVQVRNRVVIQESKEAKHLRRDDVIAVEQVLMQGEGRGHRRVEPNVLVPALGFTELLTIGAQQQR